MKKSLMILMFISGLFLLSCGANEPTGTLQFRANGEDFVRNGFVSKDGWAVSFDHVYVTLADVTAYQSSPPYSAVDGAEIDGLAVSLADVTTVDLAAGDSSAEPILVGEQVVPVGHYNAISWDMTTAVSGEPSGATVMFLGTAVKDDTTIEFELNFQDTFGYRCGEYVGDARKGVVVEDGVADVEMTFHVDHIFGDEGTPQDDALNLGALGFEPLAELAENGRLSADSATLATQLSATDYETLQTTLATLGHVGEGHCYEFSGGFTGE